MTHAGFWSNGDAAGVSLCTAPPLNLVGQLADLNCVEHLKAGDRRAFGDMSSQEPPFLIFFRLRVVFPKSVQARAFLAGDDVSNMGTMTDAPPKKKKGDAAGQSWDILSPSLTDPSRYRVDAANKKDVSRLLAFSTGGVPSNFADNYHFKLAMKTLQEVLVGSAPWKPPGRKDLAKMRPLESAAAVHDTSVWMASTRHLTLAVDGRKMAEGRFKESMLNTAVALSVAGLEAQFWLLESSVQLELRLLYQPLGPAPATQSAWMGPASASASVSLPQMQFGLPKTWF